MAKQSIFLHSQVCVNSQTKNHKYVHTVEQKVWSESERGKRDSDTMLESLE